MAVSYGKERKSPEDRARSPENRARSLRENELLTDPEKIKLGPNQRTFPDPPNR